MKTPNWNPPSFPAPITSGENPGKPTHLEPLTLKIAEFPPAEKTQIITLTSSGYLYII